jgi:hypothetical protein
VEDLRFLQRLWSPAVQLINRRFGGVYLLMFKLKTSEHEHETVKGAELLLGSFLIPEDR